MPKLQRQAQCKFSDGKAITVTYSSESKTYRLVTSENLVTVQGINVPAGDYTVLLGWDHDDKYTLRMRQTKKGQAQNLPPIPMSVSTSPLSVESFLVSFDQTGGSCMMHWGAKTSNLLFSLEFTQKNADLPVLE